MSDVKEQMHPGHPGRGYDPTIGFTDLQWYFYHQRAVAHFGAFSTSEYDPPRLLDLARSLISAAPQFLHGYRGTGGDFLDTMLQQIISLETVPDLDGLPDHWVGDVDRITDNPDLPMLRICVAQLADGPDAAGRRSFVFVEVAHALTEGDDFRSPQPLPRCPARTGNPVGAPHASARRQCAGGSSATSTLLVHLAISRLWTPHGGALGSCNRVYPRRQLHLAARDLGVSQRALFLALVSHVLTGAGTPDGKRISATYTTMASGGGEHRDQYMRMRLRFADFENRPELPAYASAIDERLKAPEKGFEAEQKAASLSLHRRLPRLMPFLYSPKFFAFWSYDVVFSLLTPHQLAGPLTDGMLEPIYCGATIPGVNGCFVVPGRDWVSFNFVVEAQKLGQIDRLDTALNGLATCRDEPTAMANASAATER